MRCYLVGGAVRDRLLGLPVSERDWVVVGSSPQEMAEHGFRPVGRDFPVFLHPQSGEEYALARTERKSGRGYHGFVFHAGPGVTLEEDLRRRDLTVNAMAEDQDGRLIDPFGGRDDLKKRCLRHVSPAFGEDPVRILRVARFAARFHPLGFTIADETLRLMRQMVDDGEVDALVPERVWQETARSLMLERPSVFFRVLRQCGALARLFPEVDALFGVPQPPYYHPEVDSGEHTLLALDMAARLQADQATRFAVLCHDLGKALTPKDQLPSHRGHEARGEAPLLALCERLRVPRSHRDLALPVTLRHLLVHRARELRAATLLRLLEQVDAFRRPQRFDDFLLACEADARGRGGLQDQPYPQAGYVRAALAVAGDVEAREVVADGFTGPAIGPELAERRRKRLHAWIDEQRRQGGDCASVQAK